MLINFDRASKEASHATDLKAFCHLLRWMTEQCISENGEVTSHFFMNYENGRLHFGPSFYT